jgi:hypothetical protein
MAKNKVGYRSSSHMPIVDRDKCAAEWLQSKFAR